MDSKLRKLITATTFAQKYLKKLHLEHQDSIKVIFSKIVRRKDEYLESKLPAILGTNLHLLARDKRTL